MYKQVALRVNSPPTAIDFLNAKITGSLSLLLFPAAIPAQLDLILIVVQIYCPTTVEGQPFVVRVSYGRHTLNLKSCLSAAYRVSWLCRFRICWLWLCWLWFCWLRLCWLRFCWLRLCWLRLRWLRLCWFRFCWLRFCRLRLRWLRLRWLWFCGIYRGISRICCYRIISIGDCA